MEGSNSTIKRKAEKVKKGKIEKKMKTEHEIPPRRLNEDLIEQMEFLGHKSKRSKFSSLDKLKDKYSEVSDIWTRT